MSPVWPFRAEEVGLGGTGERPNPVVDLRKPGGLKKYDPDPLEILLLHIHPPIAERLFLPGNCFRIMLLCWGILRGQTGPTSQSEKRYGFPARKICVISIHADDFWNAEGWGRSGLLKPNRIATGRPFLNGRLMGRPTDA